jgi:hypothetical protein
MKKSKEKHFIIFKKYEQFTYFLERYKICMRIIDHNRNAPLV